MLSTPKPSDSIESPPMLHLIVSDAEDLDDLPLSHFPCLDSRPGTDRIWQSTEVSFKDVVRLRSFCRENDVSFQSVFQAAWALVLRCYLGNSAVCFAYNSSETPEDADKHSNPNPNITVCRVEFGAGASILDVLKEVDTKRFRSSSQPSKIHSSVHQQSSGPQILPINTSLVYREEKQRYFCGVDRPAIQTYAGSGLSNV